MKFFTLLNIQATRLILTCITAMLISMTASAVPVENLPWGKELTFKNTATGEERCLTLGKQPVIKQKAPPPSSDAATPAAPSDFEVDWTITGDLETSGKEKVSTLMPAPPQLRPSTYSFHSTVGDKRGIEEISAMMLICRMLFSQEIESKKSAKYGDTSPITGANASLCVVDIMHFGWHFPGNNCGEH